MAEYDYGEFAEPADINLLTTIATTADRMLAIATEIAELDTKRSQLVNEQLDIQDRVLPELMDRAKMEDFKTQSGVKVQVGDDVRASLPVKDTEKLLRGVAWLRENGHGAIIKNAVTAEFGMGHDEDAVKLYQELRKRNDATAELKTLVHHATLTALVKELLDAGTHVPMDILGASVRRVAKVTLPRKRQPRA